MIMINVSLWRGLWRGVVAHGMHDYDQRQFVARSMTWRKSFHSFIILLAFCRCLQRLKLMQIFFLLVCPSVFSSIFPHRLRLTKSFREAGESMFFCYLCLLSLAISFVNPAALPRWYSQSLAVISFWKSELMPPLSPYFFPLIRLCVAQSSVLDYVH